MKRFGRNKKRKLEAKINELTFIANESINRESRLKEQISSMKVYSAGVYSSLERLRDTFGKDSVLLPPRLINQLNRPFRYAVCNLDDNVVVAGSQPVSMERLLVEEFLYHLEYAGHDNRQGMVHFKFTLGNSRVNYAISESSLRYSSVNNITNLLSSEMAVHLAQDIKRMVG